MEKTIQDENDKLPERTRNELVNITLVASYEAGIDNEYSFEEDILNPGLVPQKEGDFESEFQIIEDGSRARALIDDRLPTLAIVQFTFIGQLEIMAANLLDPQQKRFNIIGLTGFSVEQLQIDNGKIFAHHGFMVLPGGKIVYGRFDSPVKISAMEETDFELESRDLLESTDCQLFTGGILSHYFQDKAVAKEMFSDANLPYCPSVACYNPEQIKDVDEFLDKEDILANDLVVVKPCHGQCGVRVAFLSASNKDLIHEQIQRIAQEDDGALIEKFVRPFKIVDDEDPHRVLGANVRAASIGSMSRDSLKDLMFARVGESIGPINVFSGAKKKSIGWFFRKATAAGLDQTKIMNDILSSQMAIRNTGVKTFGADYVIDAEGNTHLIEVNTLYFGAMPYINNHEQQEPFYSRASKLKGLLEFVEI
jgi:hypothetical protein